MMPAFFLIHGAWHWGGCFQKVADELAAAGFAVATPDLASHGYNSLPWQAVDRMETYTAPVRALLAQSPAPVILVGHSLGGSVLSYLAQTMPEKIKALVYLAAFMTPEGKTTNEYSRLAADDPSCAGFFQLLSTTPDKAGLVLDLSQPTLLHSALYEDCSAHDVEVARRNLAPITSRVPIFHASGALTAHPRHYILCTQDKVVPPFLQRRMVADCPGTQVHELSSGHSPFFSAPAALAALLSRIAG